ncbi:DUF1569 domain-containing protein [Chryseobacterium soli]|uniref:DUF1569 domain-containing protein n=1 Tax=Chryseobacterium soli TaxID=445961 RepID=UPI0029531379|nr:DUF1569 domain-containing protein [Chryseobacterium soli]MDV7695908.1 DUF1569 domain-containing protein [Chryseobacterium soli]
MKKSLHNRADFEEIRQRISGLSEDSPAKWGKMKAAQMMKHCDLVLQVALKNIDLPCVNVIFGAIGIMAKIEMQLFNNGIPRNMPTFQKLIVNFECDFDETKKGLLQTLEAYWKAFEHRNLPDRHELFGEMTEKDWGFLEYKHLNHHFKQFNI